MRDGELPAARDSLDEALRTAVATTDMPIVASVAVTISELAVRTGDPERAARLLGAAAVLRGADDATALDIGRLTRRLVDELGEEGFRRAYGEGRALDREAALALLETSVGP